MGKDSGTIGIRIWLKIMVLNCVAAVIIYCLSRVGVVSDAIANDILYIEPAILLLSAFGFIQIWRDVESAHWCAETCVSLGLAGTAYGIWLAFSGIDPDMVGDVNQIGAVVGVLLTGLGAALWTTLTGIFANIWLTANIRVVEANAQ